MKRKIKFRGKDILTDKWAYGDLLHLGNAYAIVTSYEEEELEVNPISDRLEFRVEDIAGVYPETVGQFTGLLDKNGKEIYEGDIIRYTDMDSFVVNPDCDPWLHFSRSYAIVSEEEVVFEDGVFCNDEGRPICYLGWESIKDLRECLGIPDGDDCDVNGTIVDDSLLGIEIIGNIHDNPELLKGGAE